MIPDKEKFKDSLALVEGMGSRLFRSKGISAPAVEKTLCGPRTCWVSPLGSGTSRDPNPRFFFGLNETRGSGGLILMGKDLVLFGGRSRTIESSTVNPVDLSLLDGADFHFLGRDLVGGGFDASEARGEVSSGLAESVGCKEGWPEAVSS